MEFVDVREYAEKLKNRTPEQKAADFAAYRKRMDAFYEAMDRLNETEPLPDNFEDLCKGRAWIPIYSKK